MVLKTLYDFGVATKKIVVDDLKKGTNSKINQTVDFLGNVAKEVHKEASGEAERQREVMRQNAEQRALNEKKRDLADKKQELGRLLGSQRSTDRIAKDNYLYLDQTFKRIADPLVRQQDERVEKLRLEIQNLEEQIRRMEDGLRLRSPEG